MDDEARAAFTDAVIREAVGLAVLLGLLWMLGPGKVWLAAAGERIRQWQAERDPHGGIVRQFANEVSRWDHEQAAQADRKAAGGGPCGCGG